MVSTMVSTMASSLLPMKHSQIDSHSGKLLWSEIFAQLYGQADKYLGYPDIYRLEAKIKADPELSFIISKLHLIEIYRAYFYFIP